jgi:hypothetical protein
MSMIQIATLDFYDIIDTFIDNDYCPCGFNADVGCPYNDENDEPLECGQCWECWFMEMGALEKE